MDLPIEKLKHSVAFTLISIIILTLTSGFLFFYTFYRNLFFTIDDYKLSILSIGITLPLLLINFILLLIILAFKYTLITKEEQAEFNKTMEIEKNNALLLYIVIAALMTSFQFYIIVCFRYFYNENLYDSLCSSIYFFIGMLTAYISNILIKYLWQKIKKKPKINNT